MADAHLVEVDVGGPRALLAHLGVLRADLDARGVGGHEEHRDPGAVGVGGPGAREGDEEIRGRRVGDEPLLTGDDPVRSVANGLGAQARRVGPGAGFGQCERGDDVAGRDALEPSRLLLVRAEADQDLARDAVVGAEHRPEGQRRVAELHGQLDVLSQVQSQPAPLLGDRVAEQAHLLGLVPDVVGHPVVVHDLELARHHHRPDEVSGGVEDVAEVLVTDFCVGDWVCHASYS